MHSTILLYSTEPGRLDKFCFLESTELFSEVIVVVVAGFSPISSFSLKS